ncbi:hypothetical protein GCM10009847_02820 [Leucobacter tardus]|uniref:Uncharacterized protein n=1 Tax=Leucobacter tardus TaxID=501483 RepID=A0A939QIG2_9MICO|nr:hypothetical protein [Leucobacter tardus]MBO2988491.1 hypothetical protein [Leucobacter tardus]
MTEHEAYGSLEAAVPKEVAPETTGVRRSIAPAVAMGVAIAVAIAFAVGAVVLTGPSSPLTRDLPAMLPPSVQNADDFSHPAYALSMECDQEVRPIYGDDEITVWVGEQHGGFGATSDSDVFACMMVDVLDPEKPVTGGSATAPERFNTHGFGLSITSLGEIIVLPANAPLTKAEYGGMQARGDHVLVAPFGTSCDARTRIPTTNGLGALQLRPMCGT